MNGNPAFALLDREMRMLKQTFSEILELWIFISQEFASFTDSVGRRKDIGIAHPLAESKIHLVENINHLDGNIYHLEHMQDSRALWSMHNESALLF